MFEGKRRERGNVLAGQVSWVLLRYCWHVLKNRMITGGEDALYIARRLVVVASEDVGLADPQALPLVCPSSLLLQSSC